VERIPILKVGDFLLVTIQVDMHDRLALALQDELTDKIVGTRARGVLIDISSLDIVDSFIGRMLGNIAGMSRILDAETVVVGMQPSVAITLVELGLSLPGIRTALNVDRGMALLRTSLDPRKEILGDNSETG
jgi:rsbT antagonist protein RsbS